MFGSNLLGSLLSLLVLQARAKVLELFKSGHLQLSEAMELLSKPNAGKSAGSEVKPSSMGNGGSNKRPHDETGEDSDESDDEQKLIDTIDSASSALDTHLFLETYMSLGLFSGFDPMV